MRTERNLMTIGAGVLVLFLGAGDALAFKGGDRPSGPPPASSGSTRSGNERPSGPPPSRRGEGYQRSDPTRREYRSDPRQGSYPENRAPGQGQKFYGSQPFSPYGGPQRGGYGERKAVQSSRDAQRMLNDYYGRRNMRTGPIRENQFYYEADILDRNSRSVDRVIIDKRSGRIRSVY